MVHPTTGEMITRCKHLMHNPKTAEIWQTVFGKDFGSMAQRDNKMGQKGTNSVFVMTGKELSCKGSRSKMDLRARCGQLLTTER
jgi:hypothetical protein